MLCHTYQLSLIIIFSLFSFTTPVVSNCRSTIGRNGVCVRRDRCPFTIELEAKVGIFSRWYQHYLDSNLCGFRGPVMMICCPIFPQRKLSRKPTKNHPAKTSTLKPNHVITARPKTPNSGPRSLLPSKCGVKYDIRVVGGESMRINEFPWMVILEYYNTATDRMINGCGGTLISNRYVITAGHCIRGIPGHWRLERVRAGEYNTQTELDCVPEGDFEGVKCADRVLLVNIQKEIVHEEYWKPGDYANDIALLRLHRELPTTEYIQPICLPSSPDHGDSYWASGWGKTEYRAQSSVKLKVKLPHFEFGECSRLYSQKRITLDGQSQMCAGGERGKDTCSGDSGGPLMRPMANGAYWIIDGIVSMGQSGCGKPGWPGVYTRVYHYIPWILSELEP